MGTRKVWLVVPLAFATAGIVTARYVRQQPVPNSTLLDGSVLLPNGWAIKPAGHPLKLMGDMPTKMAWTADGTRLLVVTSGWHNQSITLIDPASEAIVKGTDLGSAWSGLALDGNTAYIAGGKSGFRQVLVTADGLQKGDASGAERAKDAWSAGLAVLGKNLFALDMNNDVLVKYSLPDLKKVAELSLPKASPYSIEVSPDGKRLAISEPELDSVAFVDPDGLRLENTLAVGKRPNEMVWGKDGRLFIACGGSNAVSVVKENKVVETILTAVDPKEPIGCTPDAVALSPDGKTLYVANADNNDVAVVDVSRKESVVRGLIPTGWYPSALAVSPDGKKLFIGTAKGMTYGPNGSLTNDGKPKMKYIASMLQGHVSVVDVTREGDLAKFTAQVLRNMPPKATKAPTYDAGLLKSLRKIKHVVYVIRENRTYDQVFGDMEKGNGDKSLVMFGEEVTPNAHALAREFVLLDNLYCNGEVSEDGHQWCNAAYATDFTEKAWVNSYSGRGEPDDEDGKLSGSPAGYLWDNCRKAGKSYLSYGEFTSFKSDPNSPPRYDGTPGLEGHASLKWTQVNWRDTSKIKVFIDDLHQAEKSGHWNDYMVMSLGEDHTSGMKAGAFTPQAAVASNDYAIGQMVDAISHSKFWPETAIFIIEDDAQNGPDHVDAHRTVGLVISPYTKRGIVDSNLYTTSSYVRTMELILGLNPMTQYDDRANPLWGSFTSKADTKAYACLPPRIDLNAKNPSRTALAERSAKLDWSHYDAADPDELNRILWASIHPERTMPAPVRSARIR